MKVLLSVILFDYSPPSPAKTHLANKSLTYFHVFLSLMRAPCMSVGERLFTGAWASLGG